MSAKVYVSGLPSSASKEDIIDFFTRVGTVVSVEIPATTAATATADEEHSGSHNSSDATLGVVQVVFESAEDALSAVSISGSDYQDDVPITVTATDPAAAVRAAGQATEAEAASHTNHHNSAIGSDDHDGAVADESGRAAATSPEANRGAGLEVSGRGRGAQNRLSKAQLSSSSAAAKGDGAAAARRQPRDNSTRIVVKGAPSDVTEAVLRAFFAPDCGEATDIFINKQRGIAFLAFSSSEAAATAIRKSGMELLGSKLTVEQRAAQKCFRCGAEGHQASQCHSPAAAVSKQSSITCHQCGQRGHMARDCRTGSGFRDRRRRSISPDRDRRRRRRSPSPDVDRDQRRRRRRSDSPDSDREYRRRRRSDSPDSDREYRRRRRSSTPPRRRRVSRSRTPPRGRR